MIRRCWAPWVALCSFPASSENLQLFTLISQWPYGMAISGICGRSVCPRKMHTQNSAPVSHGSLSSPPASTGALCANTHPRSRGREVCGTAESACAFVLVSHTCDFCCYSEMSRKNFPTACDMDVPIIMWLWQASVSPSKTGRKITTAQSLTQYLA